MLFALKKLLTALLMPTSVLTVLLGVTTFLLWRDRSLPRSRVLRISRGLVTLCLGLVLLLGNARFAGWATQAVETDAPSLGVQPGPIVDEPVNWIVVLGGGHRVVEGRSMTSVLNSGTVRRLVEAVRLHRRLPDSRLYLSGGAVDAPYTEAFAMRSLAIDLGVAPDRITLDEDSLDTAEQAVAVAEDLGTERFILVSSAAHLPRALGMMRARGLEPIPAPTDFGVANHTGFDMREVVPSAASLQAVERAWRAVMGRTWAALRGQT